MVLRKERPPPVGISRTTTMSNEQPVTKRQRIDTRTNAEVSPSSSASISSDSANSSDVESPPDLIVGPSTSSSPTNSSISSILTKIANESLETSASSLISTNSSSDEVDKAITISIDMPDLLKTNHKTSNDNEMAEFEEYLAKQCLCGVSERALRKPFQSHYHHDLNGIKRIANLCEWPSDKLLQFLSNLQLLFEVYLKQNSKGFICSRIMDVCDALVRNDQNLVDEIIDLANSSNKYVQFLSGRVLASFLVIAKNNLDDNWLKKLVDHLFQFDRLDTLAIQKMHFSLEVIKRIVEWKDIDLHPLEDEIENGNAGISSSSSSATMGMSSMVSYQPTLENNYFAVHFNSEMAGSATSAATVATSVNLASSNNSSNNCNIRTSQDFHRNEHGCNIVTLTDSESFDTTHLKCVTIKILDKWPALVKNMSNLISGGHLSLANAESCVMTFLHLWENIISVKANLPIVETLPFFSQLDKFELLLNNDLPCTIYQQMLSLFNEALCYGSTLALQDLLPEETCMLAHQIVRHVKDFRILDSLPRRQPDNNISLIGFKGATVAYEDGTFDRVEEYDANDGNDGIEMDKTILQKMVLLVLKSVAVTVKEIRSDSSDSSIDSTDYDAFQDMVLIERSIRDVLKKLESFIKNTLEFHPECHFSKILIHLFDDQDDHLIEAMLCTLDVTAGISFRNNAFPELVSMLNPVYTFLEFLKMISNSYDLLLDLLVSNETCFLLYLLRFLKYIRLNWSMFVGSCQGFGMGADTLDGAMSVLIRLRLKISRLVSVSQYPYDISPVLRLMESCEGLYEGNELS